LQYDPCTTDYYGPYMVVAQDGDSWHLLRY
jgi:hypothetical protein